MPVYTTNGMNSNPAEHGICAALPGAGDLGGSRLIFQSHSQWVLIPGAGRIGHATGDDNGIYTKGQFQCVAVIVARFNLGVWTEAHLAHVSHPNHSKITELVDNHTQPDSIVAIGARAAGLNWMNQIAQRFSAVTNQIWIYAGQNNTSPDFGMNKTGYFGETVSWVSAH
jgi:hypothetical protein